MKLRNLLFVLPFVFIASFTTSCMEEDENIVPQPLNNSEEAATVGNDGKDGDPKD